ncbi:MAG: LCP family protein [Clostridia bacterium]|nr:LCP family protein [Clostridia bacterium]
MNTEMRVRRPKEKKRSEGALIVLIIAIFTLIAVAFGIWMIARNFNPAQPVVDEELPIADTLTDTDNDGNTVVVPVEKDLYVRREGVYNFLLVGYDKAAGLTDVNMIAQFDVNTGKVSIVQLPRDTYARYNENGRYKKINGAFGYFKRDLGELANYFEETLCIKIDFYASIDLAAFRNIVDIIGGVPMYVPRDMEYDDPEQDLYINLKEGFQTLNGEQAEQFVRFRKGYIQADIGRTNAQKIFMTAFVKQFKAKVGVSTLTQIGGQMLKYAKTNMTLNDFVYFAKAALSIDLDSMSMLTIPGQNIREHKTSGTWYYVLSHDATLEIVNEYLNVYGKDITPEMFDSKLSLTNPEAEYMVEIYNSPADVDVYNGGSVDENGIYIPPTKS